MAQDCDVVVKDAKQTCTMVLHFDVQAAGTVITLLWSTTRGGDLRDSDLAASMGKRLSNVAAAETSSQAVLSPQRSSKVTFGEAFVLGDLEGMLISGL